MVEELGITQQLLEADVFAGLIDLLEGDAVAAEHHLRGAYEGLREHGLGIAAALAAAFLGRALLLQSRAAEAEALSHESEALAGDDLLATITWRGVRAEALARRGEHAAAIDFARAAVDIAAATDVLLFHAEARQVLATVLRAAGRRAAERRDDGEGDAAAEEKRAIELWEAKGATLLAERARSAKGAGAPFDEIRVSGESPSETGRGSAHAEPVEARGGVQRAVKRRVRPNAATANAARMEAAIAVRNADALPALLAEGARCVHYPTDRVYGREAWLDELRSMLAVDALKYAHEPLATLGNSLGLCRRCASFPEAGDFGPTEIDAIVLIEVDAEGGRVCTEVFAEDRLGDGVARLYERYAELLPDGPARTRAGTTARSIATLLGPLDADRHATAIAPTFDFVDHGTLGLFGSTHRADVFLRGIRALSEIADDIATCVDDVLDLRSDALLVRWTNSGTVRAGGGAYEKKSLQLRIFGADGLLTRVERFDADRDNEALARFDELTGESRETPFDTPPMNRFRPGAGLPSGRLPTPRREGTPAPEDASSRGSWVRQTGAAPVEARGEVIQRPVRRRVRPNAATANAARLEAAVAARDAAALPTLFTDDLEALDHTTGAAYGRKGVLFVFRSLLKTSRDPTYRSEPLATLGDWLALVRSSVSASGASGRTFDVGAYEREEIALIEVDAFEEPRVFVSELDGQGRPHRQDVYNLDQLDEAWGPSRRWPASKSCAPGGRHELHGSEAVTGMRALASRCVAFTRFAPTAACSPGRCW